MLAATIAAFAGLGFFLAGLQMLSEAVRALAARRLRLALVRFSRLPFANVLAGSLLGALTQSTSASAFVCIGLLNARALSFEAALTVSAWASVGTSILVFLASIDLRTLALLAIAIVGLLYLASLHRDELGRRTTELLLAIGVTLFGLTMLKATGHSLADSAWVREFFTFASESWIYSFIIGFIVTLVLQSSATVSALAVMLGAAGLMPLAAAMVLVCGANAGSGMSVAMISAHLTGLPRQLALWQAVVKFIGAAVVLPLALLLPEGGAGIAKLTALLPISVLLSCTFLLINVAGAVLSDLLRKPLLRLMAKITPADPERRQYEPEFIIDEVAEDAGTALLLARREQAKLVSLLPAALAPLRHGEAAEEEASLDNATRHRLALTLAGEISDFVSEAIAGNPAGADVTGLLLLQRCNAHILPLIDSLHGYVSELSGLATLTAEQQAMCTSMTETLHLLLGLLAEQGTGDESDRSMLEQMTGDRSEVMTRFRRQIVAQDTQSNATRESLFVATGLFERMVWLVRQLSADFGDIAAQA